MMDRSGPVAREAPIAGRHLPLSAGLLLAGIAHLLLSGTSVRTLVEASPLIAMGAFVVLILGTSRLLVARFGRLTFAGPVWLAGIPAGLVTAGALATYLALAGLVPGLELLAPLWGVGLLSHLGLFGASLASASGPMPVAVDPTKAWILASSGLYGLGSALLLPVAVLGALPYVAALHLLLPGFVVLTIVTVVVFVLPMFSGTEIPPPIVALLGLTGSIGPAAIAMGLAGVPLALPVGAVLETITLGTVGLGLLMSVLKASRWRETHVLYGVAGVCALVGAGLGVIIAFEGPTDVLAPVHGLVNLLGFVGGVVLAASLDLYAPGWLPALDEAPLYVWSITLLHAAGAILIATGVGATLAIQAGLVCIGGAVGLQLATSLKPLLPSVASGPRDHAASEEVPELRR